MQIGMQLEPSQQLQLIITPELKQVIQILQYSSLELHEFLHEHLEENPLIEFEYSSSDHKRMSQKHSDAPSWEQFAEDRLSFVDQLEKQLVNFSLSMVQERLCRYLIGSLDERGYLDIEQEEVAAKFPIRKEDWEICLEVLHALEPAGIGARSLAECLIIQLKRKNRSPLAIEIVEHYLEELALENWEYIAEELGVNQRQLKAAIAEIRACDPEPARQLHTEPPSYLIPDVTVKKTEEGFSITYNDEFMPKLRIRPEYQQLYGKNQEVYRYFQPWMKSARLILKGLEQRRDTLIRVTQAILEYQQEFLTHGALAVKPLTLRQIAEKCDFHESTISRATREKYMQTPHGLFPFRFFFPSGIPNQRGADVSVHQVKQWMQQLIQQEPSQAPFSDQMIAQILNEKEGLIISRRTISKYRQEMGIPSSVKRKKQKHKGAV